MVEYLYDCIRATAGENICICASIENDAGELVSEGCHLMLFDGNNLLAMVDGYFNGDEWSFIIPADVTMGLIGRYQYCICEHETSLCFKQPIYLL